MKCSFCGNEIPPETDHCPGCGAPCQYIEKKQPTIQKETIIIEKSGENTKKHEDYVPMGSSDISFLDTHPQENVIVDYVALKWGIAIGLLVLILIIIFMASC